MRLIQKIKKFFRKKFGSPMKDPIMTVKEWEELLKKEEMLEKK